MQVVLCILPVWVCIELVSVMSRVLVSVRRLLIGIIAFVFVRWIILDLLMLAIITSELSYTVLSTDKDNFLYCEGIVIMDVVLMKD